MIYAQPSAPFSAIVSDAPTGLTGVLGYRIIRNSDGHLVQARTTAGISEIEGLGVYLTEGVAPAEGGAFTIIWDQGGEFKPAKVATEGLVVTYVAPHEAPEAQPEEPAVDFTNILDEDFPVVDRTRVRPSVQEIAFLERTRTVDDTAGEAGNFTATTRPTHDEVEGLINLALELTLSDLPDYLPESIYPRVQQAVALKAAVLVETSYYREQYTQGSARGYETMYDKLIASIEMLGGMGTGQRVDSIMGRSTMAEFEPDLPIPPPRVIPKTPIPFAGDPNAEGQA